VFGLVASRVRRLNVLGVELEFTEEQSREIRRDVESVLASYRRQVVDEFDHWVDVYDIVRLHDEVVHSYIKPSLIEGARPDLRSTIYVPDLILMDGLYQLINYFPRGGGRGRVITNRFGLVGRAFRAERSEADDEVPTSERELILNWGMTLSEARRAGHERESFACVLLEHQHRIVGGVYVDAKKPKAFGPAPDAIQTFRAGVKEASLQAGLTEALSDLTTKLIERGPRISVAQSPV
jgi:hypothetical protein